MDRHLHPEAENGDSEVCIFTETRARREDSYKRLSGQTQFKACDSKVIGKNSASMSWVNTITS